MKYAFIEEQRTQHSVRRMCYLLEVRLPATTSGAYGRAALGPLQTKRSATTSYAYIEKVVVRTDALASTRSFRLKVLQSARTESVD